MMILPLQRFISPMPMFRWLGDWIATDRHNLPEDSLTPENQRLIDEAIALMYEQGLDKPEALVKCQTWAKALRHRITQASPEDVPIVFPWLTTVEALLRMEALRVPIVSTSGLYWSSLELEDPSVASQEVVGYSMLFAMQRLISLRLDDYGELPLTHEQREQCLEHLKVGINGILNLNYPEPLRLGFMAIFAGWLDQHDYAWALWERLYALIDPTDTDTLGWVRRNQIWLGFSLVDFAFSCISKPVHELVKRLLLMIEDPSPERLASLELPTYQKDLRVYPKRKNYRDAFYVEELADALYKHMDPDTRKSLRDFKFNQWNRISSFADKLEAINPKRWPLVTSMTTLMPFQYDKPGIFKTLCAFYEAYYYPEFGLIPRLQTWLYETESNRTLKARRKKICEWARSLEARFDTPFTHWLPLFYEETVNLDTLREAFDKWGCEPIILASLLQTQLLYHDYAWWPVVLDMLDIQQGTLALTPLPAPLKEHFYMGAVYHNNDTWQKIALKVGAQSRESWAMKRLMKGYLHHEELLANFTLQKMRHCERRYPNEPMLVMLALQNHMKTISKMVDDPAQLNKVREALYRHDGIEAMVTKMMHLAQTLPDSEDMRTANYMAHQWLITKARLEGHHELAQALEDEINATPNTPDISCDIANLASWVGTSGQEVADNPDKFFEKVIKRAHEIAPLLASQLKYSISASPTSYILATIIRQHPDLLPPEDQFRAFFMVAQSKPLTHETIDHELNTMLSILEKHPALRSDIHAQMKHMMESGSLIACAVLALGTLFGWFETEKSHTELALEYFKRAMPISTPSMVVMFLLVFLQRQNLLEDPRLTEQFMRRLDRFSGTFQDQDFTTLTNYLRDRTEVERLTQTEWTLEAIKLARTWTRKLFKVKRHPFYEEWALFVILRHKAIMAEGPLLELIQEATQGIIDRGNPDTCMTLAGIFYNGQRIPMDVPAMLAALEIAGVNNPNAKLILGILYHQGHLVDQNKPLAIAYWQEAKDMGHPIAGKFLENPDSLEIFSPEMHN